MAASFYDQQSRFVYPSHTYPVQGLVEASINNGDCSKSVKDNKSCIHVIPSAWEAGRQDAIAHPSHILSVEQRNGIQARLGFFIPKITAERHPEFVSYFGLSGEERRNKIVETFKTPITWKTYCSLEYADCTNGDNVTKSFPQTEEEENSYFVEGLYTGHFRNECTALDNDEEKKCVGHVASPQCSWTNYVEAQMYWNNIALDSNGSLEPNKGYASKYIRQIYSAANATNSDVMIWYWEPDKMVQAYVGTDYEMIRIKFPEPRSDCIEFRLADGIDRCSESYEDRIGGNSSLGSCDYQREAPSKILSYGLLKATNADEKAVLSPAMDFLNNVVLPKTAVDDILRSWESLQTTGNVDDPVRESLCQWVYENIESFETFIPRGHPRQKEVINLTGFSISGGIFGGVTLIVVIISFILINRWKTKRQMRFAQVNALQMTAIGKRFYVYYFGMLNEH